jgi:hypothetical protein
MHGAVQVWRKGGGWVPLTLYAAQLALNLAWSPIFFKKHELGLALADITGGLPPSWMSQLMLPFPVQQLPADDEGISGDAHPSWLSCLIGRSITAGIGQLRQLALHVLR